MDSPCTTPSRWATIIHRGPGFLLGKFECPAGASAWSEENWVGDHPHVVFPRTSVLIRRGRAECVADPNMAVLYEGGETFRRELIDPRGDFCFYAELGEDLAQELFPARSGGRPRFPDVSAPVDSRIYALQWRTIRMYEHAPDLALALDEGVLAVLARIARDLTGPSSTRDAGQQRVVERTKKVVNEALYEPLTLGDIAARVHSSPYHLTRLFRRYTGMPLHRYRTQLRLRATLGHLESRRALRLRDVAAAAGFSSHSHFSAKFREAFGFTPLEWRDGELEPCSLLTAVFGG